MTTNSAPPNILKNAEVYGIYIPTQFHLYGLAVPIYESSIGSKTFMFSPDGLVLDFPFDHHDKNLFPGEVISAIFDNGIVSNPDSQVLCARSHIFDFANDLTHDSVIVKDLLHELRRYAEYSGLATAHKTQSYRVWYASPVILREIKEIIHNIITNISRKIEGFAITDLQQFDNCAETCVKP